MRRNWKDQQQTARRKDRKRDKTVKQKEREKAVRQRDRTCDRERREYMRSQRKWGVGKEAAKEGSMRGGRERGEYARRQ